MTIEKLKEEAKKHGYHLVKNVKTVKILPCPVCGCKSTDEFKVGVLGYRRKCRDCKFEGPIRRTKTEAKEGYNESVKAYTRISGE